MDEKCQIGPFNFAIFLKLVKASGLILKQDSCFLFTRKKLLHCARCVFGMLLLIFDQYDFNFSNLTIFIWISGSRWKKVRSTLTPTFSAAKMKKMATIMTDAITIMIHVVQKHAEARSEANFYDLFQALTLDVIGNFVRILCIIAYPINVHFHGFVF